MNDPKDIHDGEEKNARSPIETAADDLFNYAIDRQDIKWLSTRLPKQTEISVTTLEYELQLLKIITVGWSITFHLNDKPHKTYLSEAFWRLVFEFARQLSDTTGLMIGQDIDYFSTLKERLDLYVAALNENPQVRAPAEVIGPAFAGMCGKADDLFVNMTGSRMFNNAVTRVGQYLKAVDLL